MPCQWISDHTAISERDLYYVITDFSFR
jgi:hypothetical protein